MLLLLRAREPRPRLAIRLLTLSRILLRPLLQPPLSRLAVLHTTQECAGTALTPDNHFLCAAAAPRIRVASSLVSPKSSTSLIPQLLQLKAHNSSHLPFQIRYSRASLQSLRQIIRTPTDRHHGHCSVRTSIFGAIGELVVLHKRDGSAQKHTNPTPLANSLRAERNRDRCGGLRPRKNNISTPDISYIQHRPDNDHGPDTRRFAQ